MNLSDLKSGKTYTNGKGVFRTFLSSGFGNAGFQERVSGLHVRVSSIRTQSFLRWAVREATSEEVAALP